MKEGPFLYRTARAPGPSPGHQDKMVWSVYSAYLWISRFSQGFGYQMKGDDVNRAASIDADEFELACHSHSHTQIKGDSVHRTVYSASLARLYTSRFSKPRLNRFNSAYLWMIKTMSGLRDVGYQMKEGPPLYRSASQVLLQHIKNIIELLPRPAQVILPKSSNRSVLTNDGSTLLYCGFNPFIKKKRMFEIYCVIVCVSNCLLCRYVVVVIGEKTLLIL